MTAPLRIELFGGLRARPEGRPAVEFQRRKSSSLLAYLALNLDHNNARGMLIELFWDTPVHLANKSLTEALRALRQQLHAPGNPEDAYIVVRRGFARLNAATTTTDVMEFDGCLQRAETADNPDAQLDALIQAVALYKGPLLPGLYDEWALFEQERYSVRYRAALQDTVRLLTAAGKFEKALDFALLAVSASPDVEQCHYDLMRLYLKLGRPHEARLQYRRLTRILRRDVGVSPSQEVKELRKLIRRELRDPVKDAPTYRVSRRNASSESPSSREGGGPEPADAGAGPPPSPELPLVLTRFFGRQSELAFLDTALAPGGERLVTLIGPGGAGKTRLAIECGRRLAAAYQERVYFVPLSEIRDSAALPDALANALRIPRTPVGDPEEKLIRELSRGLTLVVLDNFEQIDPEGRAWVWRLLNRAPQVTLLVTSRQPLDLYGEALLAVQPLPVPARPGTPDRLMEFAGVQMFVDRAQAVRREFEITRRNAASVAAICEKLEGIPLAIELAAAHTRALSPRQVLHRLEERLEFLTSRQGNIDPRHQSLRAAITWSYELLPPEMARLFTRLAVFRGTWTLDQAAEICGNSDVYELLQGLLNCSMLAAELKPDEMRFSMLETLREYADEMLDASERASLWRNHALYFLEFAESVQPALRGSEAPDFCTRIEAEHDNLRAALGRFILENTGLRLAAALWRFWFTRGYVNEGRDWLARALAASEEPSPARAQALNGLAVLSFHQGDQAAAAAALKEALRIGRKSKDSALTAETLNNLGVLAGGRKDMKTARARFEECLRLWIKSGDRWGEAACLNNLGRLCHDQADYGPAREFFRKSRELYQKLGDRAQCAVVLNNEGSAAFDQQELRPAFVCFQQSLDLFRELKHAWGESILLHNLGEVRLRQENLAEARELFEASVKIKEHLGDRAGIAISVAGLGAIAREQGDARRAARLVAAAEAVEMELGISLSESSRKMRDMEIRSIRGDLPEEEFEAAWAAGAALPLESAVVLALERETPNQLESLVAGA